MPLLMFTMAWQLGECCATLLADEGGSDILYKAFKKYTRRRLEDDVYVFDMLVEKPLGIRTAGAHNRLETIH